MGSGSFDPGAYRAFSHSTAGKTTEQVYTARAIHASLNPKNVKLRESRDSADNPSATPIIVALDVTGSMGMLADVIARTGLGTLFNEILDTKPIPNPHIMFMAIGDSRSDDAPLQVSQFEADNRIVDQLVNIWLEHGGGGNRTESYSLPWYFAARHTEHDSYIKRGKRGYLFTVGDEEAPTTETRAHIEEFIGDTPQDAIDPRAILSEAERTYDVYHIMIAEGSHAQSCEQAVRSSWTNLLGERAVWLKDHTKLAETIVGIIEMAEGAEHAKVAARFGDAVGDAVKNLPKSRGPQLALK